MPHLAFRSAALILFVIEAVRALAGDEFSKVVIVLVLGITFAIVGWKDIQDRD